MEAKAKPFVEIADNLTDVDPLFVSPAGLDFRLRPNSPAFQFGFKPIPFDRIGLYRDQWRQRLPDREAAERKG